MKKILGPIVLLLLAGCLPVPNVRLPEVLPAPEFRIDPTGVTYEYVSLPGFDEPNTPDDYDRALYMRYFDPSDEAGAATRTILVLSPGIFNGAASFHTLARQLVASTVGLEVWAVDRRANSLENRTQLIQALTSADLADAYGFYVSDVGKPTGFVPRSADELDFMRYWSLEVHLQDLHEIIKQARDKAETVILGGHSLSGAIVGYYAAYRLPGEAGKAGQDFIDGLVLLDGVIGRTGGFSEDAGIVFGPLRIEPDLEEFLSGEGTPYFQSFGYDPESFGRRSILNLLAHQQPDDLADSDHATYDITNLAYFGVHNSRRYGVATAFSADIGEAENVKTSGNVLAVVVSGTQGASSVNVVGPAGPGPVTWTSDDVITDPQVWLEAFSLKATDPSEWYFPARLAMDLLRYNVTNENTPGYLLEAQVTIPTLLLGAEYGLVQNEGEYAAYLDSRIGYSFTALIIPGYTHVDILHADNNPAVTLIQRWLMSMRLL